VIENMPEFPGGESALYAFLKANLQYPTIPREVGIDGIVYTEFIVEKDGSISSIKILRSPHEALSAEAMRVIQAMPKWIPGKQRTVPVRVRLTLPIKFVLH